MCSRKCETPLIVGVLIARAGLDEQPGGEGMRIGIDLGDDVEAVGELLVMKVRAMVFAVSSLARVSTVARSVELVRPVRTSTHGSFSSFGPTVTIVNGPGLFFFRYAFT